MVPSPSTPELLPQFLPALPLSPTSQLNDLAGRILPREDLEDAGQATLALCLSQLPASFTTTLAFCLLRLGGGCLQ